MDEHKSVETNSDVFANLNSIIDPQTGKSRYRTNKLVNCGGSKSIYSSFDKCSGRNIAMAMLTDPKPSEEAKERFIYEARITANLEHPNIVPVHEIGYDKSGNPYFTMKLIGGESLSMILDELKNETPEYVDKYNLGFLLDIFRHVCNAVALAHSKGIIHLDIKPENIQVGEFGEVLVLDWGLAKYIGSDKLSPIKFEDEYRQAHCIDQNFLNYLASIENGNIYATIDGAVKGSPGYMAPEQAAGENSKRSVRTDIYALGALLYSILTLEKPFHGNTVREVLEKNINGNLVPPHERTPDRDIPNALEAITAKAMKKKPEERYESVHDLIDDLKSYRHGFATSAENAGLMTLFMLMLKRHKFECSVILAVLLTLIISFRISYVRIQEQKAVAIANLNKFKKERQAREAVEIQKKIAELEKLEAEAKKREAQKIAVLALKDKQKIFKQKQVTEEQNKQLTKETEKAIKKKIVAEKAAKEAQTKAATEIKKAKEVVKKVQTEIKVIAAKKAEVEQKVKHLTHLKDKAELVAKQAKAEKEKAIEKVEKIENEKQKVSKLIETEKKITSKLALEKKMALQIANAKKLEAERLARAKEKMTKKAIALAKEKSKISKIAANEFCQRALWHWNNYQFERSRFYADLSITYNPRLDAALDLKAKLLVEGFDFKGALSVLKNTKRNKLRQILLSYTKRSIDLTKLSLKQIFDISMRIYNIGDTKTSGLVLKHLLKYKELSPETKKKSIDLLSKSIKNELRLLNVSDFPPNLSINQGVYGGLSVELSGYLSNISPLKGLNITELKINSLSKLVDLELLQDFNLVELYIYVQNVGPKELSFLKNSKLKKLFFYSQTALEDVSPLVGMPLESLTLRNTRVPNLSFLKKSKLRYLSLFSSANLSIKGLKDLQIEHLELSECTLSNISVIKYLPLNFLDLSKTNIKTLNSLSKLRLTSLIINDTEISSLKPIAKMPLERLEIMNTKVNDLSVLEGMPLRVIQLTGCIKIEDLSPLKECPALTTISIPLHIDDFSFINALPNLQYIDVKAISGTEQTVGRFKKIMNIK